MQDRYTEIFLPDRSRCPQGDYRHRRSLSAHNGSTERDHRQQPIAGWPAPGQYVESITGERDSEQDRSPRQAGLEVSFLCALCRRYLCDFAKQKRSGRSDEQPLGVFARPAKANRSSAQDVCKPGFSGVQRAGVQGLSDAHSFVTAQQKPVYPGAWPREEADFIDNRMAVICRASVSKDSF